MLFIFAPHACRTKGIMINISSTGAFQPLPYIAVYGATKSYVLQFTELLRENTALQELNF